MVDLRFLDYYWQWQSISYKNETENIEYICAPKSCRIYSFLKPMSPALIIYCLIKSFKCPDLVTKMLSEYPIWVYSYWSICRYNWIQTLLCYRGIWYSEVQIFSSRITNLISAYNFTSFSTLLQITAAV